MTNIFVTKYYIKYFDDKDYVYYFPTPLYDKNGQINDEVLTLSLNKIKKLLKIKELNLILLDPNSYAINIKNNETFEDVSLYIDNEKFNSYNYLDNYGAVLNIDRASIECVENISKDLKLKINLFSFLDYLMSTYDVENDIFFVLDKNFYFFTIFENSKLVKYFYDDRNFYNNRAIENLKIKNPDASDEEIFENLDFEIAASLTSTIYSIVNNPSEYNFHKYMYKENDSIDDYLKTSNFSIYNEIDFYKDIEDSSSLIKENNKVFNFKLLKYLFPIVFIFIIMAEIFYYQNINRSITHLENQIIDAKNTRLSNLVTNEHIQKEKEKNENAKKEYEDFLNSNIFISVNDIFDIINNLSRNYEVIDVYTEDGKLYVYISSDLDLLKKYEDNVLKEFDKNGSKFYLLEFEVENNEVKWRYK